MTNNEHNRIRQVLFAEEEGLSQALHVYVFKSVAELQIFFKIGVPG